MIEYIKIHSLEEEKKAVTKIIREALRKQRLQAYDEAFKQYLRKRKPSS